MENENIVKTKRQLVVFFGALVFVVLYGLSWLKWGDLYVDSFRDQYIISRVLDGSVLYKDVVYLYGFFPISLLILANVFLVNNLFATIFVCTLCSICTITVFYRICRLVFDRGISCCATILFITAFIFNALSMIFNYILPYSSASVFFIMFALLGIYSAGKVLISGKKKYRHFLSLSLAFSCFCRLDMGILLMSGVFVFGVFQFFQHRNKSFIKDVLKAVLFTVIGYVGFLLYIGSLKEFIDYFIQNISWQKNGDGAVFERNILGLNFLGFHLKYMIVFSFIQVFSAYTIAMLAKKFEQKTNIITRVFLSTLFVLYLVVLGFYLVPRINMFFMAVPLLMVFVGLWFMMKIKNKETFDVQQNFLCLVFIVSSMFWLRIGVRPVINSYFFYLGVPSLFVMMIVLFKLLPERIMGESKRNNAAFRAFVCIYLILISACFSFMNLTIYSKKEAEIITLKGVVKQGIDARTAVFVEAVEYLKKHTSKEDSVLVLPEGYGIYFFSDRMNALKDHIFLPLLVFFKGEDVIIQEISENKIDYIVLVYGREAEEYGASFWGVDYAQKIDTWIHANYSSEMFSGRNRNDKTRPGIEIFKLIPKENM